MVRKRKISGEGATSPGQMRRGGRRADKSVKIASESDTESQMDSDKSSLKVALTVSPEEVDTTMSRRRRATRVRKVADASNDSAQEIRSTRRTKRKAETSASERSPARAGMRSGKRRTPAARGRPRKSPNKSATRPGRSSELSECIACADVTSAERRDTAASEAESAGANGAPPRARKRKQSPGKKQEESPRVRTPRRLRNNAAKSLDQTVTPESSPIAVTLTPHRSTKTPRKSPMNLSSPKSHSRTPLRLSKTPRKLPVTVDSPAVSDNSEISSSRDTSPKQSTKVGKFRDEATVTPGKQLGAPPPEAGDSKLSKSPRIVLTSPKLKPPKTGPRVVSTRAKRSPVKSATPKSPKLVKQATRSPLIGNREMSLRISRIVVDPVRTPVRRVVPSTSKASSLPVIAPKTATPASGSGGGGGGAPRTRNSALKAVATLPLESSTPISSPVKTPPIVKQSPHGGSSPRRSKSTGKKRSPITETGTPLRPIPTPKNSASKKLLDAVRLGTTSDTPTDVVSKPAVMERPLSSSTPREKIRRSLNLSPDSTNASPSIIDDSPSDADRSKMPSPLGNADGASRIKDDSTFLLCDAQLMDSNGALDASKKDVTYEIQMDSTVVLEVDEKTDEENVTYDLAEPKTPNLRRLSRKRSSATAELDSSNWDAKKRCKVRFASPPVSATIGERLAKLRKARPCTPVRGDAIATATAGLSDKSDVGVAAKKCWTSARRRSNSLTNISVVDRASELKRRSNSVSDVSARTPKTSLKAQNASANRLSKPKAVQSERKVAETRTPVARKAPNFAEIHQRKFARMESLVDAKKRLEERHLALNRAAASNTPTTTKATPSKMPLRNVLPDKVAPIDTVNGVFNRFGFKLRKHEALQVATKKPQTKTREKQKQESRAILKGVRTNRRFELQMKTRNINL